MIKFEEGIVVKAQYHEFSFSYKGPRYWQSVYRVQWQTLSAPKFKDLLVKKNEFVHRKEERRSRLECMEFQSNCNVEHVCLLSFFTIKSNYVLREADNG